MTDDSRKYWVCCPMCDLDKCVKGSDKCEAEIWAKKEKERHMKEIKAYWDKEAGCFKEYNDEFDLTIHFETEEERKSFVKSLENYEKLKEAVEKTREDITERANLIMWQKDSFEEGFMRGLFRARENLEKHTEGLL